IICGYERSRAQVRFPTLTPPARAARVQPRASGRGAGARVRRHGPARDPHVVQLVDPDPRGDPRRGLRGALQADRPVVQVAEAVGRALASLGVDAVFGLLGSGNLTATNALREAGVPFHSARHEGGAICMADGYGRVSGRLAACSVHQGPGLTNTVTGLTEAAKSRTPLLVLAADTPAAALRSNFRIDQAGLVEAVGAVAERVHGPETAMADVARAVRRARVERRAVVLMLPLDVQAMEVPDGAALPPTGPE